MRIFLSFLLALVIGAVIVFVAAGRASGPAIVIHQPGKVVGFETPLAVSVEAPKGAFKAIDIKLEQGTQSFPLFSLGAPGQAAVKQDTPTRVQIERPIGRKTLPDLQSGNARIVVTATRPVLWGLRTATSTVTHDFRVRLEAPHVSIISIHHFVNFGGAEMVVYRATPPDVESGVQVGDRFYRGYPASDAGVQSADKALMVGFFALLYDQETTTPIRLYAKDEAGNEAHGQFDYKVFPKVFRKSNIELNDAFLQRVVPEILERTPELKMVVAPGESYLPAFLKINRDLRHIDAEKIASFAAKSEPKMLWSGPFRPLGNAAIESSFADHRTYFYQGKEVDQQVHLGFDLAVTVNIPVQAANDGKIVWADYLGIYGNCVIIDHGLGVQSLYAHLSSIDVKPGDMVKKDQVLGRSGMTGLAGGDHLHFSMLVGGYPVNSVEWWDPHWIQDRVTRKITEASAGAPATAAVSR